MDEKRNVIINNIISIFVSLVLVIILLFVYNMFMAPKQLEITEIDYTPIDRTEYSINDDQLDGTLFDTLNFQFTDKDLDRYEDLKEYYKGRDNPFNVSENRNEVTMPDFNKGSNSDKDIDNDTGTSNVQGNNGNDDIDIILD